MVLGWDEVISVWVALILLGSAVELLSVGIVMQCPGWAPILLEIKMIIFSPGFRQDKPVFFWPSPLSMSFVSSQRV